MSNCTPCTPANDELPIFCDPNPATDTAKRLLVEDEAFCQKALTSPTTASTLVWDNGIKWASPSSQFNENTNFKSTGSTTGRNLVTRHTDILHVKDFGAVGNGSTNDTAALNLVKNAVNASGNSIVNLTNGKYFTSSNIWNNNIQPTTMYFDKPSILGLFEGNQSSPDTVTNDPVMWVQKWTKYSNTGDRFAHNVGGVFGQVYVEGTKVAGSVDTEGTWIGILGSTVINGTNQGSQASPDYDAFGNSIGIAGFAQSKGYPGNGNIVTGVWGYAVGPTIDATTFSNLPATNWALCGMEANIQINTPDIGEQSVVVGKGCSVGFYAKNFRDIGTGVKDWQFALALNGNPNDGNYASTDIDNWNGFYTGILLDKIKGKGIRFGKYFKNGSYGIWFPDSYEGTQRPAAGIYLGNNQINMGQYLGTTFNNNDLWQNGGNLYFRTGGTNYSLIQASSAKVVSADAPINGYISIKDQAGNTVKLATIA